MNINSDIVINAVKKAFESNNIKSIQGINIDELIKSISESIIKSIAESVDVKDVGESLMQGLKSVLNKEK